MPNQASYTAIVRLKDAGTQYLHEDVVWGAWEAICRKYFPESAIAPGAPYYWIRRDAYRGMPPDEPSTHKPDVVVVRLSQPQVLGPDGLYREVNRDILWVECKAPCHDEPGKWKKVIEEATERLKSAHPNRNVWLIVAIGLKWMVFYWDPSNSRTTSSHLAVMASNESSGWAVDPDIRVPPPPLNPQVPAINVQAPGGYVNTAAGVIRSQNAYSLDFWTMAPNQPGQLANLQGLQLLEDVFRAVQGDAYSGPANPANMSWSWSVVVRSPCAQLMAYRQGLMYSCV